ncbi:hypothetical protein PO124_31525, partial [Bacillus licheniformis]|nr:hypothetical protein [Bacillus licheniformis]
SLWAVLVIEFNFDGKRRSKSNTNDERWFPLSYRESFLQFELDDNLREELQSIIGRIAESFSK